jgi:hypothetical protein
MKFLKQRAPERRVLGGRDSDATMLSRRREKPGFVSSVFKAASAVEVVLAQEQTKGKGVLETLFVLAGI